MQLPLLALMAHSSRRETMQPKTLSPVQIIGLVIKAVDEAKERAKSALLKYHLSRPSPLAMYPQSYLRWYSHHLHPQPVVSCVNMRWMVPFLARELAPDGSICPVSDVNYSCGRATQ